MSDATHDPNVQDPEITPDMMVVLEWTKRHEHSGRTLYDHLMGTYHLLRQWECERDVCIGGLFHAIYGTESFQQPTVHLNSREKVATEIGFEAEHLAYLFCALKRPDVFIAAYAHNHRYLADMKTGLGVYVSEELLERLIQIECANLIEQGDPGHYLPFMKSAVKNEKAKAAIEAFPHD